MKTARTVITRDPSTIYLFKLIDEIRSGALLVPYSIQRNEPDDERRNKLLNNILMGLPVGALTILHQGQTSSMEIKAQTEIGPCQIVTRYLLPRRYVTGDLSWLLSLFSTFALIEHDSEGNLSRWGTVLNLDSFRFEAWPSTEHLNTQSATSPLLPTMLLRSHRLLTRWMRDRPALTPTQIEHALEAASRFNAYKVTTIPVATDDPEAIKALVEQVSAETLRKLPTTSPILLLAYSSGYGHHDKFQDHERSVIRNAIEPYAAGSRLTFGEYPNATPYIITERVTFDRPVLVHISLLDESLESERALYQAVDALCVANLGVDVVVMSGCFSLELSERLCGVGTAVVGFNHELPLDNALTFLLPLYTGLSRGLSLSKSFNIAQNAVAAENPLLKEACMLYVPSNLRAEEIILTSPPGRPTELALAPSGRGSRPHQVVLHLDAYNGAHSVEEIEALLDDHHEERKILRLADYMTRFGVERLTHGRHDHDWAQFAAATQALINDALAFRHRDDESPVDYIVSGSAPHPTFAHVGYALSGLRGRQLVIHRDRDGGVLQFVLGEGQKPTRGPRFFAPSPKLKAGALFRTKGQVGLYLSALGGEEPAAVALHMEEQGGDFAEIVSLLHTTVDPHNPGRVTKLTASDVPLIAEELIQTNSDIARCFPDHSGVTLFVFGPDLLAFLAGRALNPRQQRAQSVKLAYYDGQEYRHAYTLPLASN